MSFSGIKRTGKSRFFSFAELDIADWKILAIFKIIKN